VVIVTGGNSGTGYATCKAFYERGATVYMASRSADKANEAIESIKNGYDLGISNTVIKRPRAENTTPGKLVFLQVDLTDLKSVETFVQEVKQYVPAFPRNCELLNTTGGRSKLTYYLLMPVSWRRKSFLALLADIRPKGQYTKQGYTLQFGTNVCGHWLKETDNRRSWPINESFQAFCPCSSKLESSS
jgi:NAD(P)-dependent dehydrogenase (short-subunit alcohol dehydrogenase family)